MSRKKKIELGVEGISRQNKRDTQAREIRRQTTRALCVGGGEMGKEAIFRSIVVLKILLSLPL